MVPDYSMARLLNKNLTALDTTGGILYYDYYNPPSWREVEPTLEADERLNPKFWAKWFREFLEELFGEPQIQDRRINLLRAGQSHSMWLTKRFNRYLSRYEWKWKDWCQSLEAA